MPFVAFDVLAAVSHAPRKPAAHADRQSSTQFADMLDKPDTIDGAPKTQTSDQPKDQASPAQAASKPVAETTEPATAAPVEASPDAAVALPPAGDAAPETPPTEQQVADFLAAVAAATGMKITPVAQPKADDKPAEAKPDDQSDDAAVPTDTAIPAETKSADAAAVVMNVQTDTTAAAPKETETMAKSAGIAAAITEQSETQVVASDDTVTIETKDAKPQVPVKTDTPALTPNLAPDTAPDTAAPETGKQAANPQAATQSAAPPQAQKADTPAQAGKPAPAPHDVRALDVASAKPADNVQPMLLVQNNTATPTAGQATLAPAPATAPQGVALPVQGIAIEIAGKALAGKNRFEIRLDPPELGRIHVRLDVDHKGEITSIITADRSDTFDLLRRDAQALERALQDAGVKTSNNGLQFSLRDHGAGRHDQPALADSARVFVRDDNLDTDIIAPVYRSFTGNRAGVDIRV